MMRLELAEAARRVRRELDSSVVEFGYFRRTAQQSAADSFVQMTDAFDAHLAKFFARLEEIARNVTLPVESASRKSGAVIGELSKSIGSALAASAGQLSTEAERLSGQVATIASALEAVTAKLNTMQTPDRLIEVQLEPVAEMVARAVKQMTVQSERQAESLKAALAVAGTVGQRSSELATALREEFDATAATNRASLEAAITMIKATADALNEIKTSSRDYVDALGTMLQRTDHTMRTFTDVLVRSVADTAARTDQLSEALSAVEARVQALVVAAERTSRLAREAR
jgi:methyl-accepting chemotaxis protein